MFSNSGPSLNDAMMTSINAAFEEMSKDTSHLQVLNTGAIQIIFVSNARANI